MTDYIYGKNSIEETIRNSPHRINKILISENNKFDKKKKTNFFLLSSQRCTVVLLW